MKCQILFSRNNKKNINMSSAEFYNTHSYICIPKYGCCKEFTIVIIRKGLVVCLAQFLYQNLILNRYYFIG